MAVHLSWPKSCGGRRRGRFGKRKTGEKEAKGETSLEKAGAACYVL
jgi:hypothetical protein